MGGPAADAETGTHRADRDGTLNFVNLIRCPGNHDRPRDPARTPNPGLLQQPEG